MQTKFALKVCGQSQYTNKSGTTISRSIITTIHLTIVLLVGLAWHLYHFDTDLI